jgi:hypothetical protein
MNTTPSDTEKEEALRRWVVSQLKWEVPQELWERLKRTRHVSEALDPEYAEQEKKKLVEEAKDLLWLSRKLSIRDFADTQSPDHEEEQDRQPPIRRPAPDDPVNDRAGAFSLYVAKVADEDEEVKQFRQEVLGDTFLLSEEEAEDFLFSPATQIFSSEWFKENSVPFTGHEALILRPKRLYPKAPRHRRGKMKVEWDGGELVAPFDSTARSPQTLWYQAAGSDPVPTMKGSVASSLLDLRDHLTERFPWDDQEALMYVLTGTGPLVKPLNAVLPEGFPERYETVNITVWPWVPVEDVAHLYKRIREELAPTSMTSSLRLALFEFVMKHPEVTVSGEKQLPRLPSWGKLLRAWNESLPAEHKWRYTDRRNLRRDFLETFDQIVNFYPVDKWRAKVQAERDQVD